MSARKGATRYRANEIVRDLGPETSSLLSSELPRSDSVEKIERDSRTAILRTVSIDVLLELFSIQPILVLKGERLAQCFDIV